MDKKTKKRAFRFGGIFLGLIGGYLYWKFVGCESGTCPITSVWYHSTLYGGVMGYLLGDLALDLFKKNNPSNS